MTYIPTNGLKHAAACHSMLQRSKFCWGLLVLDLDLAQPPPSDDDGSDDSNPYGWPEGTDFSTDVSDTNKKSNTVSENNKRRRTNPPPPPSRLRKL